MLNILFFSPDVVLHQSRDRAVVGSLGYATGRFILAGTSNQEGPLTV
ncbi:MAG: hypothetical protein ACREX9_02450 [Gammaproteobacteria bacterium]